MAILAVAAGAIADIPFFWLDKPAGRSNPFDPRSAGYVAPPTMVIATPTPAFTATISPTFTESQTSTPTPTTTVTRTPEPPPGTMVNITLNDRQGTPVAGAWVMADNDPARVGLTDANGQCSIGIANANFRLTFFSPADGVGDPLLIPHIVIVDDLSGTNITHGGVFRSKSVAVPGELVLSSVGSLASSANTLLVTWLPQYDDLLGQAVMLPASSLPAVITPLRRPGRGTAMVAEIDASGNTLGVAWVNLTHSAATLNFSADLDDPFVAWSRTYSYVGSDPRLQDFRPIMQAGTFSSTLGAFNPPPGTPGPTSFVGHDLQPVPNTYNDDPRFAAWGSVAGDYFFSWNLFQSGTFSDTNPNFYLQPPPDILSTPSGTNAFQTRENYGWGWGWVCISRHDPADPWPRFYPEDEVLRMMEKDSDASDLRDWNATVVFPAALDPARYGMQAGQSYKLCIGETYAASTGYLSNVSGGNLHVTRMSAASRIFTR